MVRVLRSHFVKRRGPKSGPPRREPISSIGLPIGHPYGSDGIFGGKGRCGNIQQSLIYGGFTYCSLFLALSR